MLICIVLIISTATVILNKNEQSVDLDLSRFDELGLNGKEVKNIITGKQLVWDKTLELSERGVTILTTKIY